jgi:hypothetical protein
MEVASPMIFIERKALEKDIIDFWNYHNFSGSPPLAMPPVSLPDIPGGPVVVPIAPAEVPATAASDRPLLSPDYPVLVRARQVKNAALVTGLILTAASVAAQGVAYSRFDTGNDAFARNIFTASYGSMGVGLITVLTGLLYNPRYPPPNNKNSDLRFAVPLRIDSP